MNSYIQKRKNWLSICLFAVSIMVLCVPMPGQAAKAAQKTFASPEQAVQALIDALKTGNTKALYDIFGPGAKGVLSSGDTVQDKAAKEQFIRAYETKNTLVPDGDTRTVLQLGEEDWPFPIPIVKKAGKWSFDTRKGKEELINRRIGRNELNTIQTCLAFVDAQREFALRDKDGEGLREYAQKFVSTPGKKDGLYWDAKPGEEESPFGDLFAKATAEGYKRGNNPVPYHGYFFKMLTEQGNNAPGGPTSYIVNGKMIGGFGMVAYPAEYGVSGIMTFIVNHDGVVYQKNLGKDTARIAKAMKAFDPDKSWKKVE